MTFRWIVKTDHGEIRRYKYLTSALEFAARRAVMTARKVSVTEVDSWAVFDLSWQDGAAQIGGKFTDVQRRASLAAFDLFTALLPGA